MIAWGPDFADYAIMAACCPWLAFNLYDALRRTRALIAYLIRTARRKRSGLRPLRIVGAPIGRPPTVAGGPP